MGDSRISVVPVVFCPAAGGQADGVCSREGGREGRSTVV